MMGKRGEEMKIILFIILSIGCFAQEADKNSKSINSDKETRKEVLTPEVKEQSDTPKEGYLEFRVGLGGFATTMDVFGYDVETSGNTLEGGLTYRRDKMYVKFGGMFLFGEIDSFGNGQVDYLLRINNVNIDYNAFGAGAVLGYQVNDNFGIGAFGNLIIGELEACSAGSCDTEETTQVDLGVRLDFNFYYWNPYIAVGYMAFTEDSGTETYSGVSAYVGLLHFEF